MKLALLRPALLCAPIALAVNSLVDVDYTRYHGNTLTNGVTQWLGIRYAAPPLGNLRFRAPRDPVANKTVQIANKHGPICLATSDEGPGHIDRESSEDCLFLDLYAPSAAKSGTLPVYVFIQGGGLQSNSNANYNGSGLIKAAHGDAVIVNFNYRVGPYGFLASREIVRGGDTNNGLKDMRQVFKWVQQHISKFGGDPHRVTVGGDSAGGGAVALHLTAYDGRDDGLFHATAAESQSFPIQLTVSESQYQYDALVQRSGCSSSSIDTLACLRRLSAAQLQAINYNFPVPGGVGTPLHSYTATIDGGIVTDYTYALFAQGKFIRVPAIWGDDTNEGTVFTPKATASYAQMNIFLRSNFPRLTQDQLTRIDSFYPPGPQFPNAGLYWRTASMAYGEIRYICPGIFVSTAMARAGVKVWNYRYNVHEPANYAAGYGTTHTEEVTPIWGPENIKGGGSASYNTTNRAIVPVIQAYWTSFIRSHDPNVHRDASAPNWSCWDGDNQQRLMFITNATAMERVPSDQRGRCRYLSGIATNIQQ